MSSKLAQTFELTLFCTAIYRGVCSGIVFKLVSRRCPFADIHAKFPRRASLSLANGLCSATCVQKTLPVEDREQIVDHCGEMQQYRVLQSRHSSLSSMPLLAVLLRTGPPSTFRSPFERLQHLLAISAGIPKRFQYLDFRGREMPPFHLFLRPDLKPDSLFLPSVVCRHDPHNKQTKTLTHIASTTPIFLIFSFS